MVKKLLIRSLLPILLLSGCGGGGEDSNSTPTTQTETLTLKLTVGNVHIDSASTLSRVTINVPEDTVNITTISTNKSATITADMGEDADLFVLKDTNNDNSKELAFISKREANNPTDANQDGVYEVDIQAIDEDGQVATYKVAYKIELPKTLELKIDDRVVDLTKAPEAKSVEVNSSTLITLSVNNNATITLPSFSPDNHFFVLLDKNGKKELKFKSKLVADNPTDSNRDGIYDAEIEIKDGRKVIYYTIPFKIEKPISQTLLRGKTYYWKTAKNIRENTMSHIRFRPYHNQAFVTNDESNRENEKVYNVSYIDTKAIVMAEDNSTVLSCIVDKSDVEPIFLECQKEINNEIFTFYMANDPMSAEEVAISPESEYIVNSTTIKKGINSTATEIDKFLLRGNQVSIDGKAQLSAEREDYDTFFMSIDFKEETDAKVYLYFHTKNIENSISLGEHITFNVPDKKSIKIEGKILNSGLFLYENTIMIDDGSKFDNFPAEAYLNLFVCDKNSTAPSFDTCNMASIPALLK